jgi:hypothetical protein
MADNDNNAMYIGFITVYAPVLLHLANLADKRDIVEILHKIKSGTQTEDDLTTIQEWTTSEETENALAQLTPEEIDDILSKHIKENTKVVKPDFIHIALSGKRKFCPLGQKRTPDCITVNGSHYSAALFEQYYNAKKAETPDGPIMDPFRNEISPELQKYLESFFDRLHEPKMLTRIQTGSLKKQKQKTNGGKKTRKSKSKKSRKTHRKQRRSQ